MAKNNVTNLPAVDPSEFLENSLAAEMHAAGIRPAFVRRVAILERQAAIGLMLRMTVDAQRIGFESALTVFDRHQDNVPMLSGVLEDFLRRQAG